MAITNLDNPFLAPPGSYPPATVRWVYFTSDSIPRIVSWVVPWQPGTPPGVLVPVQWQVTDIFFRVETFGSANSTLQITRSTSTGVFVAVNNINDTPVIILPNSYEESIRPPIINNPIVNSGDKLQNVLVLGTGAAVPSFFVTLTQFPGV